LSEDFRIADETECQDLVQDLFGLSKGRSQRLLKDLGHARRERVLARIVPARQLAIVDEGAGSRLNTYEDALNTRHLVDFDDLLIRPVELLVERSDLRETYRDRFQHLFLDEYQDIDVLQYHLVRLLAPAGGNVCAIGDPDQSIYSFRGADVAFFMRFRKDFPGTHRVHLSRNYRSSATIVEAACQAIAPSSLVPHRQLRAVLNRCTERLVIRGAASERAEAEQVVHTIEKLLGGISYFSIDSGRVDNEDGDSTLAFDDIAVLYRTDAQSVALIEALDRSGIPYQKCSHERLVDRPGVRELLQALQESGPLEGAIRQRLVLAAAQASEAQESPAARQALVRARDFLTPLADRFGDDLEAFLAEISLGAEVDTWDPRAQRISLLTLHAAKGLEFPVVFMVGCCDGLLPLSFGDPEDDPKHDEERRLFFVGMTRAQSRLFLSYPKKRTWRGRVVSAVASPFLEEIDRGLVEIREDRGTKRKESEGPVQLSLLPL
jgi:superfamily I DNA/RNA helicase